MVVVVGLDRTDESPGLQGMDDDLWSRHTSEVLQAFTTAQNGGDCVSFKEFCKGYSDGSRSTRAMRELTLRQKNYRLRIAVLILGLVAAAVASGRRSTRLFFS